MMLPPLSTGGCFDEEGGMGKRKRKPEQWGNYRKLPPLDKPEEWTEEDSKLLARRMMGMPETEIEGLIHYLKFAIPVVLFLLILSQCTL
jgi:hypothetical protein